MMDDTQRNPDGTFKDGWAGGTGRPKGTRMTWQSYADRVAYFRDMPEEELIAIFTATDFKKRPNRDCGIIRQIIAEQYEILNDREIGKPLSRGEMTGADGQPLFGSDPRTAIEGKLLSRTTGSGEAAKTEKSD